MLRSLSASWLSALVVLLTAGCQSLELQESTPGQTRLKPANMSSESVGLEIVFLKTKLDDVEINEKLWAEVDEQRLPAELRRRLAENGFRVGLIGSTTPAPLAKLLAGHDSALATKSDGATTQRLDQEPTVTGRHLQLRSGMSSEIQASRVYDQLPLLTLREGQAVGNLLPKAQAVFQMKPLFEPGGAVRLTLAPEVQYGELKQNFESSQDGIWLLQASRKRETFPNLEISTTLAAGQMLILTCLPDRPGSLGHHFFADRSTGVVEQKVVLIRLSQTQQTDL